MERPQPAEFEVGRKTIRNAIRQQLVDFGMTVMEYHEQVMGPDDAPKWLIVEVVADNGRKADVTFNREQVEECTVSIDGDGVLFAIQNLAKKLKVLDSRRELVAS
jgi:hypothetical protein